MKYSEFLQKQTITINTKQETIYFRKIDNKNYLIDEREKGKKYGDAHTKYERWNYATMMATNEEAYKLYISLTK